jgi:hypothetical protein
MISPIDKQLIEQGIKVANSKMFEEDKVWSYYSNDKVDVGECLVKVIRTISKSLPLNKTMTSLSIGSSNEPQFRILEASFRGGLYLLDIEKEALEEVRERINRQRTIHVKAILGDYNQIFLNPENAAIFFNTKLDRKKMNLATLHHSLYYCQRSSWNMLFENLYRQILAPKGGIHAVLMAAESNDCCTTTWLYNHFVGKYFECNNDQNLQKFKKELQTNTLYNKAQILTRRNYVHFFVKDFEKFMSVVWMILLYPGVHKYSLKQKEEITEFVYKKFWKTKKPLIQLQDHLVIYRGIGFKGLI